MTVMTIEDPRIPHTLPRTVSCLCRRKACITTRHALLVKCRMVRPALVHTLVSKTARQSPTLVSMPAIRRTTARGSYSLVSGEVGGSSHSMAAVRWYVCLRQGRVAMIVLGPHVCSEVILPWRGGPTFLQATRQLCVFRSSRPRSPESSRTLLLFSPVETSLARRCSCKERIL